MDRIQVISKEISNLRDEVSKLKVFISEYVLPSDNVDKEFINLVKSGDRKGLSLWRKRRKAFNKFYEGQQ